MSNIHLIIDENSGRTLGYARTEYSSSASYETTVRTTEEDLVAIFEQVKSASGTLNGADASIDAAIEDPLSFTDYLVLEGETISFDEGYSRGLEA